MPILRPAVVTAATILFAGEAQAGSLGALAKDLGVDLQAATPLLSVIFYLAGAAFGVWTLFEWRYKFGPPSPVGERRGLWIALPILTALSLAAPSYLGSLQGTFQPTVSLQRVNLP